MRRPLHTLLAAQVEEKKRIVSVVNDSKQSCAHSPLDKVRKEVVGFGTGQASRQAVTLPVSTQRSSGAEFKAGMGQISKVLEFCRLARFPPTHFSLKAKEEEGGSQEMEWGTK